MTQVDIIKAQVSFAERRRGKNIDRKRVAAYCRVSTDSEDQLNSYRSQVKYYTDLINGNKDWMMAGIYADEGITGTQVSKREGFQKLIGDCMSGSIDMVITKSISRFARNTLDTLKYVRMLKEKNIEVFFEDEHINTLSMDGELLLVVLSSVAQQEVENISSNVKKGIAMKMSRGELVGFSGAIGYDYHPETKTITVNEEQAKIVKYIFRRYIEGAGCNIIGRELEAMGAITGKGCKTWYEGTVMGIIKNEKYKGDLLQGKTFTVDPISKRRLENRGESDKYLLKGHHEAIISEEIFEQAQAILAKRSVDLYNGTINPNVYRSKFSRTYTFSSIVRCGFCGVALTRRCMHSKDKYRNIVWHCVEAVKHGKDRCPLCKAISEKALENAFVESFQIITNDHKDVLEEFLIRVEATLCSKSTLTEIDKTKKGIDDLNDKLNRLLDMHLENRISYESYEQKKAELEKEISIKKTELYSYENQNSSRKQVQKRIESMRTLFKNVKPLEEFDAKVFESIIEKVIVGGYDENGNADPFLITFVYKTGYKDNIDGNLFKPERKNARKKLSLLGSNDNQELSQLPSNDTAGDTGQTSGRT